MTGECGPLYRMIFEGYEFNELYAKDQNLPFAPVTEPGAAMLEVTGALTPKDVYAPTWGAVATHVDPLVPPAAPDSPYALVLRGTDGSEIVRYSFDVDFEGTHGDTDLLPLTFVVPAPAGYLATAAGQGGTARSASRSSDADPAPPGRGTAPGSAPAS